MLAFSLSVAPIHATIKPSVLYLLLHTIEWLLHTIEWLLHTIEWLNILICYINH